MWSLGDQQGWSGMRELGAKLMCMYLYVLIYISCTQIYIHGFLVRSQNCTTITTISLELKEYFDHLEKKPHTLALSPSCL